MIDWLVQDEEMVNLKGDSYRLKERDPERVPTDDVSLITCHRSVLGRRGGSDRPTLTSPVERNKKHSTTRYVRVPCCVLGQMGVCACGDRHQYPRRPRSPQC
jgi:hypothetical protein